MDRVVQRDFGMCTMARKVFETLPLGSTIPTEPFPSYAERDRSFCQKRVCELEEKRWRFDGHESGPVFSLTVDETGFSSDVWGRIVFRFFCF